MTAVVEAGHDQQTPPTVVGRATAPTHELAGALGASLVQVPVLTPGSSGTWDWSTELQEWESSFSAGPSLRSVVVAAWSEPDNTVPLSEYSWEDWRRRVELPLSLWLATVRAALSRCAPGASLVIVAERPAPIDSCDRADLTAVAEGLGALARSAALIRGAEGIRVNVVASTVVSAPEVLVGLPPPLPTFPGRVSHEVAGAVRALLSDDMCGVTGTLVAADCGRSW